MTFDKVAFQFQTIKSGYVNYCEMLLIGSAGLQTYSWPGKNSLWNINSAHNV